MGRPGKGSSAVVGILVKPGSKLGWVGRWANAWVSTSIGALMSILMSILLSVLMGTRRYAVLKALLVLLLPLPGLLSVASAGDGHYGTWGVEPHQRAVLLGAPGASLPAPAVLTLDACGGAFDADLIATLVRLKVPATIFVTKLWLDRNAAGVAALLAHPELFELEDHGTNHRPAVIGAERRIYGVPGQRDAQQVQAEVLGAAQAIQQLTGRAPRYYRGATAIYDSQSLATIAGLGFEVAGFSVNADAGASLPQASIEARLLAIKAGDVVIAHMNKPAGKTAKALAAVLPKLLARGLRFGKLSQVKLVPA